MDQSQRPLGQEIVVTTWVGIDNGVSGAVAILCGGAVELLPTPTRSTGGDTRIDAKRLHDHLASFSNLRVAYEQGQKLPKWGTKGNFANGRSDGVLETTVEFLRCPYRPVNPQTWQKEVFAGIRRAGQDTKAAAIEFCRRTFPEVDLRRTPRCAGPDPNKADALCIAWWAKNFAFRE